MSAEYRSNHYVPQWYQRQFIPADARDQELFLLDLRPEWFRDGRGTRRRQKTLRRRGPRKCFAIDDLYTTRLGGVESRELERVFFGAVDTRGKRAVEFFSDFAFRSIEDGVLQNLMLYMSTQKLRTPKGLDWLVAQSRAAGRADVLGGLTRLRMIYGAIWAECVWQIADASESPTKFIVSDHPVTVYNRSCSPGNPLHCRGPNDPDIRFHATHTLFPLTLDKILILTNASWACSPYRPPLRSRGNPMLERGAMFNFLDVHTGRKLSELEVQEINFIIKRRAYRYIAAGREEWLYPEREVRTPWRSLGAGHLLMPDPRGLIPGSEYSVAYRDGSYESMDSLGRLPGDEDFGQEGKSAAEHEAHARWSNEFEALFDTERRGTDWEGHRAEARRQRESVAA